jgi:hypothetical protein
MVDEKVSDEVWVTVVATGYGDRPLRRSRPSADSESRDRPDPVREADHEPRVRRHARELADGPQSSRNLSRGGRLQNMMVLAIGTVAVIVIVVAVVVVLGVIFLALGPLSSREQLRDDYGREVGAMGVPALKQEPERELDP